jgi:UDP-N-acetylmuramyl pentapeptide phosphotransferase/UDP-N-acetylglucosamine-1-phosphate transferase
VPILTTVINQNQPISEGVLNRSNLYFLIAVPAVIVISAGFFNGVKSFNKINLALGSIIAITLFVMAVYEQDYTAQIILSTVGGIFIFLQMYNFTNVKLSLGKVGRFSLGAIVACAAILQNTIIPFLILLIPYLIYHLLYKKKFDREQLKLRSQNAPNDSPEQREQFQNAFLYLTLLGIIFSVVAITSYIKL